MNPNIKYILLVITIILFCSLISFNVFGKDIITYDDQRLSVDVENIPLGSLLLKIQDKTGIEFYLNDKEAGRNISVHFHKLELEKAIKRLLGHSSNAIIYASNGKMERVVIHSSGTPDSKLTFPIKNADIFEPKTTALHSEGKKDEPPWESEAMILSEPAKEMVVIPPSELNAMLTSPPIKDMQVTPVNGQEVMVLSPTGSSMNAM